MTATKCDFHFEYPKLHEELGPGCQFAEETEFFRCGTKNYCQFHLPMSDEEDPTEGKGAWSKKQLDQFWNAIYEYVDRSIDAGNATNLTGVVFPRDTVLKEKAFQELLCYRTQFEMRANFENATVERTAIFQSAQFRGDAYFQSAQFRGDTSFGNAQFRGDADFQSAQFRGRAFFSWSSNSQSDPSDSVAYDGSVGTLLFARAAFGDVADFSDRIFAKASDFSDCVFEEAPTFHGSKLHQGTSWIGARFRERRGPEAERSYRTLRLAMENIRDRPQEGVFFALEQETFRNNLPSRNLRWWMSWTYGAVSSYGQSLSRPLEALLLVSFFFFHWYGILYCFTAGQLPPTGFGQGIPFLRLTLLQLVKPLAIWGKPDRQIIELFGEQVPLAVQLSATVQSLLSATLIGLFILALRWQFRRA